jgi:hypothetical protein
VERCKYWQASTNSHKAICKRIEALRRQCDELDRILSPVELCQEYCMNPSPEARTQCCAYNDMEKYGRSSDWSK